MKGSKGKAPAVQWYYKDWLSDRQLQRARVSSRGVWMNLLMYMIDCSGDKTNCKAGRLEYLTIREICSLAGCDEQDAWAFIEDALQHGFCDVELEKNMTFHVMSRRLSIDSDRRSKWRGQKKKQRKEKDKKRDVHPNVRNVSRPSPRPSSTPITIKNNIEKKTIKRKCQLPVNFPITPPMNTWFQKQQFVKIDLERETEKFIDHFKSTGDVKKDWVAAWRNWMRKAEEWSRGNKAKEDKAGWI